MITQRRILSIAAAIVAGVLGSACSSGSSDTTKKPEATATTLSAAAASKAYEKPGPNPVGVVTLTLPTGNKAEVWYPAAKGTTGTISYDMRDFTPAAIKALLTADIPATFSYDGARGATAAEGTFPLVLFSHGFSGIRLQSSFLTSHLASWGMVVASPDHPSRDLPHALTFQTGKPQESVDDLAATLNAVKAEATKPASPLYRHVDVDQVAAVGHSAGGGTVLAATRQIPAIDGYVSLASGIFRGSGAATTVGATTTTMPPMPEKPSLFVAGKVDGVVDFAQVTKPAFDAAAVPTRLWVIDGLGHNGFDDFCTFGNGKGIIGVAEASGLGPTLSKPPFDQFKKLGEDGCIPPAVPVAQTWPIIKHVVTSWLRNLTGTDPQPVGLGPGVADEYQVKVRIEERLG